VKCERCGRRAGPRARSDKCLYCGGPLVAAATAVSGPLPCPACKSALAPIDDGGIVLDRCQDCGGTWYDRGELQAVLARPPPDEDRLPSGAQPAADGTLRFELKQTTPEYRPCPHCRQPMMRRNYGTMSGVVIDVCGRHGAFLDAGELERIRAFVASGGPEAASEARQAETARAAQKQEALDRTFDRMQARRQAYHGLGWSRWGRGHGVEAVADLLAEAWDVLSD
jgi:Zn-finger nucleic acid-binding protein